MRAEAVAYPDLKNRQDTTLACLSGLTVDGAYYTHELHHKYNNLITIIKADDPAI